jgi:hypothetical protein
VYLKVIFGISLKVFGTVTAWEDYLEFSLSHAIFSWAFSSLIDV